MAFWSVLIGAFVLDAVLVWLLRRSIERRVGHLTRRPMKGQTMTTVMFDEYPDSIVDWQNPPLRYKGGLMNFLQKSYEEHPASFSTAPDKDGRCLRSGKVCFFVKHWPIRKLEEV